LKKAGLNEGPLGRFAQQVREVSKALQARHGLPIEEAREKALDIILGGRDTAPAPKRRSIAFLMHQGGPPWLPPAECADAFGISRRTIERWAARGCMLALPSGHVSHIRLRTRPGHVRGRAGRLLSAAQVQILIAARAQLSAPGRKLPALRGNPAAILGPITPKLAANMWRCTRALTLLRGVTDKDMLRRLQQQVGLLIRKRL